MIRCLLTPMAAMIVALSLLSAGCAEQQISPDTGERRAADPVITKRVMFAIMNDTRLKTSHISVKTSGGVVHLTGYADSAESVRRAGDIAAGIPDVISVANNLVVKEQDPG